MSVNKFIKDPLRATLVGAVVAAMGSVSYRVCAKRRKPSTGGR